MFLISITLLLILVGFVAFVYGTIALSKFAFRISTGRGVAALLFPPYTLYFAFSELHEEDKDIPAAAWVFGFLVTALLVSVFATPLSHLVNGRWDKLEATSPGEAASEEFGDKEDDDEESDDDSGATADDESDSSDDESSESDDEKSSDDENNDESEGSSNEENGDKKDETKDEEKKGEKEGETKDEEKEKKD